MTAQVKSKMTLVDRATLALGLWGAVLATILGIHELTASEPERRLVLYATLGQISIGKPSHLLTIHVTNPGPKPVQLQEVGFIGPAGNSYYSPPQARLQSGSSIAKVIDECAPRLQGLPHLLTEGTGYDFSVRPTALTLPNNRAYKLAFARDIEGNIYTVDISIAMATYLRERLPGDDTPKCQQNRGSKPKP